MKLVDIGKTEEGRPQWMAIITSPENIKKLARYKEISRKLAHRRRVSPSTRRARSRTKARPSSGSTAACTPPKSVGSQQLMEMVYQMVSRNDPETMRFLNDVIMLCVQANPDGMELVANWYMREAGPAEAQA